LHIGYTNFASQFTITDLKLQRVSRFTKKKFLEICRFLVFGCSMYGGVNDGIREISWQWSIISIINELVK
ncbi:hypothetical protein Bhyg_17280, partial [Pseudolycoriella hygida]